MERLPPVLIEQVFDELSLRDAIRASYVCHQWRTTLLPYLFDTYNINEYLKPGFPDPNSLLRAFRRTGAVLSGSRALAYFLPSVRVHIGSSDWDIYVEHEHKETIHQELLQQKFIPLERKKPQRQPTQFMVYDYGRNKVDDGNGVKVQVVVLVEGRGIMNCIAQFHNSAACNYISGWGAASLFWQMTFDKHGFMAKRLTASVEYRKELKEQYMRRGIRLVEYEIRPKESIVENAFVVYFPSAGAGESHSYSGSRPWLKELEMFRQNDMEAWKQMLDSDYKVLLMRRFRQKFALEKAGA